MKKYLLVLTILFTMFLFINMVVATDADEISLNDVMSLVYNGHISANSLHGESNWY